MIIFDFDGTLTLLPVPYDEVLKKANEILGGEVLSTLLMSEVYEKTRGAPEKRRRILELMKEEELKAVEKAEFDEELVPLLELLRSKGFKVALVTMQCREAVLKYFSKHGLLRYFDAILTREDSVSRSEQISVLLRKFKPSIAVVVGDRTEDVEAGKENECLTIGMSKSGRRRKLLRSVEPYAVVGSFSELKRALASANLLD